MISESFNTVSVENVPLTYSKPMQLFLEKDIVKICAPMVRYSKLSFRTLVRSYDCDLAFTPMIVSSSFNQSAKARDNEFTTNSYDRPLIVQFAANNAVDLSSAAKRIARHADGIDLNCGCPQRWALSEGYGACLINKPELLHDMISQTRNIVPDSDFTVSIKIRIHSDIKRTIDLCQKAESAGLSFLTVHGRTQVQRNEPVNYESIRLLKESLQIPVVANGDIFSLEDANEVQSLTGVNGVMSARGLLENPAMFSGYKKTPLPCLQRWSQIALRQGIPFTCFHHHLMFMLENLLPKSERRVFNSLTSISAVLDYLQAYTTDSILDES